MNLRTRIWVEIVPTYSMSWRDSPDGIKTGKVVRRRPSQVDRARYLEIVINAEQEQFAPIVGVTL